MWHAMAEEHEDSKTAAPRQQKLPTKKTMITSTAHPPFLCRIHLAQAPLPKDDFVGVPPHLFLGHTHPMAMFPQGLGW